MDKNKQPNTLEQPAATTVAWKTPAFDLSDIDLGSDFTNAVDPSAPPEPSSATSEGKVKEAPTAEPPAGKSGGGAGNTSDSTPPGKGGPRGRGLLSRKNLGIAAGLLVMIVLVSFLMTRLFGSKTQMITSTSQADKGTLYIDTKTHSVGVGSPTNPSGLQIGSTVSPLPQGSANIRLGLINGTSPSILFEDNQKNSWQLLSAGGSVQFIQGTQTQAKLDGNALTLSGALNVAGNTTLGSGSGNSLTIQGTAVTIPNNLNFSNNTLVITSSNGTVSVGAANSGGYKLLVAGTIKANGSIFSDGQVLAAPGSVRGPSFSFTNNTNTGIYQVALNVIGVAAAGTQVLQVQPGIAFSVNGANIEADGYLRAGRGGSNPTFQIMRFTGTLDGSGSALINDGMSTGYNRVLMVQGFYKGNSAEAVSLNVDYVNSGNFQVSGGIPGRPYRVSIMYSQDGAGW